MRTLAEYRTLYRAGQLTADDIRELFATRRNISFSKLSCFRECHYRFLGRVLGIRDGQVTSQAVVGEACHIVAEHKGDMAACVTLVKREIDSLPIEERAAAISRVEELLANRARMQDAGDSDENARLEKTVSWVDDGPGGTGWTFFAKPDRHRIYPDSRGPVLEILDEKTSGTATRRHREQLRFFGVVTKAALKHTGSICLKGRCWGSGESSSWFYGWSEQSRDLKAWRAEVLAIEACIAAGDFRASSSWRCRECPLASTCEAGISYLHIANGGAFKAALPVVATSLQEVGAA